MKQRVLSGLQPTGKLHVGNYFGAVKQWIELQKDQECFYCIVDYHALTVPQDPKALAQQTLDVAIDYLALGLDPDNATIFVQSQVPGHTDLGWILNTVTPIGELYRMIQFKEKTGVNSIESGFQKRLKNAFINELIKEEKYDERIAKDIISEWMKYISTYDSALYRALKNLAISQTVESGNAGLLNYPVLMAADILLYKAEVVPVGEDQVQHVELTRKIVKWFNNRFGKTFKEPQTKLTKAKRIMSLSDPTKKMSKSHGEQSYIALNDSPDAIRQKVKRAVTATTGGSDMDPGVANLFTLLREVSGPAKVKHFAEAQQDGTIKYSELKDTLAEDLITHLEPYQERRAELEKKTNEVQAILEAGRKKAAALAQQTMTEVREKVGLLV